jgi:protein-L-isoaspartate(D-aspartate) O-methyltransferase
LNVDQRPGRETSQVHDAAALRGALVDRLLADGAIRSAPVEAVFRTVPRHVFAPGASMEEAYANTALRTKRDEHGVTMSSVSAPWLQAATLEQAELAPGMRCLEIGSGGYNAALMAELVGEAGEVTTVDIDPDVTERARRCLVAAGYHHVRVVLADAEAGVADHAPYDRIIVTAGAWDIPPAWVAQLSAAGRLIVPLRMRGLGRSVVLDRVGDQLISREHMMAGFVPFQGEGRWRERLVLLHGEDVGLRIDESPPIDDGGLREALASQRAEAWSGVQFGGMEPFDDLFLWLVTRSSAVCLLTRKGTDAARALVDPASPIGTPTIVARRSFAYLTFREVDPRTSTHEFGAIAHGPGAQSLAEEMSEHVRLWDRDHRHGPAALITVHPAGTPDGQLGDGHVIDKRHTRIAISWPLKSDADAQVAGRISL